MTRRIAFCIVGVVAILALLVPGCPPLGTYALTIQVDPPGSGTATFTGTSPFPAGEEIPVQATPNVGYKFAGWKATAGYFNNATAASTVFHMPATAVTITAMFGTAVYPTGAMIGELSFTEEKSPTATVTKIAAGQVDLYLQPGIVSADVYNAMVAAGLPFKMSYGSYRDIRYNPVGPLFGPGKNELNPFSVPEIREAMMWLYDRNYVVAQHLGGLGYPIYCLGGGQFPESTERYPDIVNAIATHYAPKSATWVRDRIAPYMAALNCTWHNATSKWRYNDSPVVIKVLIRSDLRPFPAAGDYVANQLEAIGFTTERSYKTSVEASPIWLTGDPAAGAWHVYTGGWGIPTIPRDQASNFAGFQTQFWYALPLFKAYEDQIKTWDDGWPGATETYYQLITRLFNREFSTMTERRQMFERAMWGMCKFAAQNALVDMAGATPYAFNVALPVNRAYGPGEGWTRALHFYGAEGPLWRDRMKIEMESIMVNPWNPVDGSNWVYDLTLNRDAMTESGLLQDPVTGLYYPNRIQLATVTIGNNNPVAPVPPTQASWLTCTVQSANITVPDDTWAEWDAASRRWKTAAEKFGPGNGRAVRKSVVVYPANIFDFPMHDGSKLSVADFMMAMTLPLDIAQNASPIFEPARVSAYRTFMATFKGWRITSVNPLTIEYYSDVWYLDPCWNVAPCFPWWKQGGSNPWHMISIGWLGCRDGALKFGSAKPTGIWADYTKGDSLPILEARLANVRNPAHADYRFMPYKDSIQAVYNGTYKAGFETILGGNAGLQAEIDQRYANLQAWYTAKGHFWVDMGLYYLERVYPVAKNIIMRRFAQHPDPSNRWLFLLG